MNKKEKEILINSMEKMGTSITGVPIKIFDMHPSQGIGCSLQHEKTSEIRLAFDYPFDNLNEQEKKVILYGVFAHEVLHIIRTGFAYERKQLALCPANERNARHDISNIIEDPAIEYLGSDMLPEFLKNSLQKTIGYFYKNGRTIDDAENKDAYEQYICSLIQFGDVGVLRGDFTFLEARDAFVDTVSLIEEAIEEPIYEKRYQLSQQVFEIIRPIWEQHQKDVYANNRTNNLLDQYGKKASSGNGSPSDNSAPDEDNQSNQRRKKTIHLISKEQADAMPKSENSSGSIEDATDIYVVVEKSSDDTGKSEDANVVDERDDKTSNTTSASKDTDDGTSSASDEQSSNNQTEQSSGQASNAPSASKDADDGIPSSSDDKTADSQAEQSTDANETQTSEQLVSDTGAESQKGCSLKDMLGSQISEIEFSEDEIDFDITAEDTAAVEKILKTLREITAHEAKATRTKQVFENINVEVRSPYFTDVQYITSKIVDCNNSEYDVLCDSIKHYVLNFRSRLKKIFTDPHTKKEYRTSGKVDIGRACGRKMTARVFTRRSKPDDKADIAIVILVDESGSMSDDITRVKQTCLLITEALASFDVAIKVVGFDTGGSADANYRHYGDWKNDSKMRKRLTSIRAYGGTFLGHAIRYAGVMLKNRPEKHKIFIVITDGEPSSHFYRNSNDGLNDCRYAVSDIKKFADVIGVGIYNNDNSEKAFRFIFQNGCVSMNDLSSLIKELPKKIGKIIEKF